MTRARDATSELSANQAGGVAESTSYDAQDSLAGFANVEHM